MRKIVFSLVKSVVAKALGEEVATKTACLDPISVLLLKKIEAMPVWLKFPIMTLTVLFNILGVFSTGLLFEVQSFGQQIKTVDAWQNSPIKLCREFIKFYEKLALFIYYSDPSPKKI